MGRVAVISNVLSHRNRRELTRFRRYAEAQDDVSYREIADIADVLPALIEIEREKPEILAVNGGDGTVIAVISCLLNDKPLAAIPPLLVIPGGRTNMISEDVNEESDPVAIFEAALSAVRENRYRDTVIEREIIRVKRTPDETPIYGLFFGTASVVRGIEFCRRRVFPLNLPDFLSYVVSMFVIVGGALWPFKSKKSPFRPEMIEIEFDDGRATTGQFFVIILTTLDRMLLGIPSRTSGGDGHMRFHGLAYRTGAVIKGVFAYLFGLADRRAMRGVFCHNADAMTMRLQCPYTLDGEIYYPEPDTPVELKHGGRMAFIRAH